VLLTAVISAGVLLGFASETNRFGLDVSNDVLLFIDADFTLPNRLIVSRAF
jgi:hypothetical protein